jgi:hypothetical protein
MRIKLLALLTVLVVQINSQQTVEIRPDGVNSKAEQDKPSAKRIAIHDQVDLDLIRSFAARAFAFEDPVAKVSTETALADRIWSFDPSFAKDLLIKTFYFTNDLRPTEANAALASRDTGISKTQVEALRALVLSVLSRRDPKFAKRLVGQLRRSTTDSDLAYGNLLAARTSLASDDVDQSIKFAEQSLKSGVQSRFLDYLVDLRNKDERSANALFQRALDGLAAESYIDPLTLMYFGYYLFRVPQMSPAAESQDFRIMQNKGGVAVWNISADRPGISGVVVRAYLSTAAKILSRQPADPKQHRITYVTAYELSQKAQRWAPDLIPFFSAVMQKLDGVVPNALKQPSTYDLFREYKIKEPAELLKEIDEVFGEADHDRLCVTWAITYVDYEKWSDARKLAEKISAIDLRSKVLSLVNYSEARKRLKDGELSFATEVVEKLPLSLARPLLALEIARRQSSDRDQVGTMYSLGKVLQDARAIDADQTPYLLLRVATELSKSEPQLAIQTFNDAIKSLNRLSGNPARWVEIIEIRGHPFAQYNLLQFENTANDDFAGPVNQLFSIDPEGTVAAIMNLKHEHLLGKALTIITSILLKNRKIESRL